MLAEAWAAEGREQRFVELVSPRARLRALAGRGGPAPGYVLRPGFPGCAPWWALPGGLREVRTRRAARALRRELERDLDLERAVALVVTPFWAPWLAELPFGRVVYDCIDVLDVQVPRPRLAETYRRWEEELLARCDGAVVTAEVLGDDLRARRPGLPVATVRNGVDDAWFQLRAAQDPRPAELAGVDRPVVGFVGALYHWIDWALIDAVSAACPDLAFVFVGPHDARGLPAALASRANVRFLGPRPYAHVPAYVQAFDASWVPFRTDAVGRAANPVKIYEYLALGKPVVSTAVADLAMFEGLVEHVDDVDQAVLALRAALAEGDARAGERRAFAARNSWRARVAELGRFLDGMDDATRAAAR
jgi:hypothetical protein